MMMSRKGGLLSREDTLGEASLHSASQQDGFVCSDGIMDRGIFSGGKDFPGDDDVKRGLWVPEMMS